MPCHLTKRFLFSASFESGGKITGHNYALELTTPSLDTQAEKALVCQVQELLIQKVHSKDFGLHVDFLKNISPTDENLLKAFWRILEPASGRVFFPCHSNVIRTPKRCFCLMPGDALRVHVAQINPTVGDIRGNEQRVIRSIQDAKDRGASLVTFPELVLTGYPPEDLLFQKHFVTENLRSLRRIVRFTRGIMAVLGFVDRDARGRLYNAAAVLQDRKRLAVYHKVCLPNYGVFDEKRYFAAGQKPCVVSLNGFRVGISICEDIWQEGSYVYGAGYAKSVDFLVNISASPYHRGKQSLRLDLLKTLARKIKAPVLYHNLVGGQDELVFDGGSMAVDARGRLLFQAGRFEEDPVTFEWPDGAAQSPAAMAMEEEVYRALVLGTRDYMRKNGFEKSVVGLSGGIDSALVACVAVDALGAQNVIGVTMPSRYTSAGTYSDACRLAKNLGIALVELKIEKIFRAYLGVLRRAFAGLKHDSAEENLQARIRGNLLMALSNKFGHLVLTTGNKSEFATGYCTLYGDMAGGFAVIKDLPKTLVYRVARARNKSGSPIPQGTFKRPPTAELRANQRDQDTLPSYPLLDGFLEDYIEKDMSLEQIVKRGFRASLAHSIARRVDRNEYKRRQAPPGVKITPKAFGRDRRVPITNRFLS